MENSRRHAGSSGTWTAPRAGFLIAATLFLLASAATAQRDLANWNGNVWQRLEQMPVTPPVADGHLIVVRDIAANKNCPADVYVVAKSAVDEATQRFLARHFLLEYDAVLASRLGKRYRTDARGMVHVDMPEDGLCLAITDGHYGRRNKQPKATYIGVHACGIVRAEVLDGQGKPAPNVIVRIGHAHNGTQFACGCTDASGRLEARFPKNTLGPQLIAQAAIASGNRGTITIPVSYFERAPSLLQLRLPMTGSVALTIHDPAGIQPIASCDVAIQWQVSPSPGSHRQLRPTAWVDGKAIFAYVGIGLEVEPIIWGPSMTPDQSKAKGPQAAGERTEMAITLGAKQLVLKGRLLNGDGQATAAQRFWVRISGQGRVRSNQGVLDSEGRFALPIDTKEFDAVPTRFEFFAEQRSFDESDTAAMTEVAGDHLGVMDVGDLTLQKQQVVLRGRVVTGDGKPSANTRVSAPLSRTPSIDDGHRVKTDQDGWFTMYELDPAKGSLQLRIQSNTWPPQLLNVTGTIGKLDHQFALVRNVSLRASLRDQQFAAMLHFEVIARTNKRTATPGQHTATHVEFLDLEPGAYDFVARLGRYQLARIENVKVAAAGQPKQQDPRLLDITWQATLQIAKLRVLSEDGKPLRTNGHVATGNNIHSSWRVSDPDGNLQLPYADGHMFFVRNGGYRTAIVTPANELTEVRLPKRALLNLSLPKGLALPTGVEMHFSSELAQFGSRDLMVPWQPNAPNHVQPEAMHETVLRLTLRDLRGRRIEFHRQTIKLPKSNTPMDVVINIDKEDASFAAEAAANMAKSRGR